MSNVCLHLDNLYWVLFGGGGGEDVTSDIFVVLV